MDDRELVNLYLQTRYLPTEILWCIYPELNDPSGRLQYKLLTIEYAVLQAIGNMGAKLNDMLKAFEDPFELLAERWLELGKRLNNTADYIEECYDELCCKPSVNNYKRNTPIKKYFYDCRPDNRSSIRRYVKNHVY